MGTVYRRKRGGKPYGFYIAKYREVSRRRGHRAHTIDRLPG